ncbi:MAG: hypothetical protein HKO62_08820, partial [Gammaproteobacteria bacterium]|nr:hypothetical protein [Gammaproteobacteria bacterium]
DTCLSIFMRDFVGMHSYSYDLNDIAGAYRHYQRVMAHWQAVLPVAPIEVEYDALVADQEAQTRRLLELLELDWDPACLAFHKTSRQVRTASFWQVRQPLYKSASARWRNYEAHLGPLLDALR